MKAVLSFAFLFALIFLVFFMAGLGWGKGTVMSTECAGNRSSPPSPVLLGSFPRTT